MSTPAEIANQALDAIGWRNTIGDPAEGTVEARIILRAYSQCLRQMLRSAHWAFARKQTPLVMLGDASGQTPGVGSYVMQPWMYCYQLPPDCMKIRFVPYTWPNSGGLIPAGNITTPNPSLPLTTGQSTPPQTLVRLKPSRFLESSDLNFAVPASANPSVVQGASPQSSTVILSNVKNATCVYTGLMVYPSVWDSLFRAAFVAYLASEIALPIWVERDRKFGLQMRIDQIKIAADKIRQARATDGNEGWYSSDIQTDWMNFRRAGGGAAYGYGGYNGGDGGAGIYFNGCDDCCGVGGTSAY